MEHFFTLAAATPPFSDILDHYGVLAVFVFVLVENFGAPIPGETMLVIASAYAASGHLPILLVAVVCVAGIWLGSTLSYLAGRRGGVALLRKLHVPDRHLNRAQSYMSRWGGYTVFLGRYVAFLRSYLGWLAGINEMAIGTFLWWNFAGAVLWTATFCVLGYLVGNNWALIEQILRTIGVGGVAVVVVAVVVLLVIRHRRQARASAKADTQTEETIERIRKSS